MSINENAPKPHAPGGRRGSHKEDKKPFILQEHLGDKPLADHDGLKRLLRDMNQEGSAK